MKEKAISVIIVMLLLLFSGCTTTTDNQTNETNGNQTQEPDDQEQNETENIAPTANIWVDTLQGNASLTVNFSGHGYDPDGEIVGYEWRFQDVVSSEGEGIQSQIEVGYVEYSKNFSHTYEYAGFFSVNLYVYDDDGAVGNDTITIVVL